MAYDPEKHHRRSIRLKGHDYAGGGLYFVTLCAHREAIAAAGGAPFGATSASPVRTLMEERVRITAEKCPGMEWVAHVIMPDHFHALIRMAKGPLRLGDVIGGFKAAVSREMRRGEACLALAGGGGAGRIWLRNYYESIVRSAEGEARVIRYIRTNPWRCVMDFGNGLRGMGNPALWSMEKIGLLCSRGVGAGQRARQASPVLSGFHSPMERAYFRELLAEKHPVIWCPAWGLDGVGRVGATPASPMLDALEENRILILEMRNRAGDLAAAEQRNRFVLEQADALWLPHVAAGGMLDRLVRELGVHGKIMASGDGAGRGEAWTSGAQKSDPR